MLTFEPLAIPEVKLLHPKVFRDLRGSFAETMRVSELTDLGLPAFVQENQALSHKKNTVRGLHFQKPPAAQAKLIRVLAGKILDVAVDVRPASPTFGKHISVVLSGDEPTMLYIPAGFAHGYCTLADNTVMLYKTSAYYAPETEGGILWNDPALGIEWPTDGGDPVLIEKDEKLPRLCDLAPVIW